MAIIEVVYECPKCFYEGCKKFVETEKEYGDVECANCGVIFDLESNILITYIMRGYGMFPEHIEYGE